MSREIRDPQSFVDSYGLDASVVVGNGMKMTLGQALAAERLLCPAEAIDRQDPAKRIGYLARILAEGGSLLQDDRHWLGDTE